MRPPLVFYFEQATRREASRGARPLMCGALRLLVLQHDCVYLIFNGQLLLLQSDLFELLLVARILERRQLAETLFVAPVLARQFAELRVDSDQLLLQALCARNFHGGNSLLSDASSGVSKIFQPASQPRRVAVVGVKMLAQFRGRIKRQPD